MIVTSIILFFASIVSFFVGLMPDMKIDFTPQAQDSLSSIISGVSALMPVNHVGVVLGLVLLVYGLEFLWLLINWLIAKIPTID